MQIGQRSDSERPPNKNRCKDSVGCCYTSKPEALRKLLESYKIEMQRNMTCIIKFTPDLSPVSRLLLPISVRLQTRPNTCGDIQCRSKILIEAHCDQNAQHYYSRD